METTIETRCRNFVLMTISVSAFLCANADVFMLKNGKTDWTDPASYTNNAVPTAASDRIHTEAGATNELRPSNPKYSESIDVINFVNQVEIGGNATLVIEVASGVTNTIIGRIGCASYYGAIGTLVKQGEGTLLQEPRTSLWDNSNYTYYYSAWRVEAGSLGAPWSQNGNAGTANAFSYGIDLASGTTLIASYIANLQVVGPLAGAGSIVSLNPATGGSHLYYNDKDKRAASGLCEFSGTIGDTIALCVRERALDLVSDVNTYSGGLVVSGFKDNGTGKGVLGFTKFGGSSSDASTLGLLDSVSLGELYANTTALSGALRYLGTTGESVSGKNIRFGYTQDAPATFDAGAYGGLSFGSGVSWTVSEAHNQRFCLTGSNTVESTFAGKFVEGANGSVYLIKKGKGVWHLKHNASSELSGPVRVEGGVLRHDTLASRGVLCALGTAVNLHDGSYVASASATPVDYSILFAGEGTGLLEYTGKYDACSSNRQVAVKTGGGFSSADGAERIHGISAYDEAETAMLTILATNNAISTYADITDGTHGGKLGITKRGGGTAEIDRELSFSGPLNVKEGKLIVRNSSGPYTWFRLTVKENYGIRSGASTTDDDKNHIVIERFALYDADGVRQNVGFSRHGGNIQNNGYTKSGNSGNVVKNAASGLQPGEIGLDRAGYVYVWGNRDFQNICDGTHDDSTSYLCYTRYDYGPVLSPSNPDSWVKYVMRLTNGTPEIASFDIAGRFDSPYTKTTDADKANAKRQPTMWSVEGSVDGINWDVLTNMEWTAAITGKK